MFEAQPTRALGFTAATGCPVTEIRAEHETGFTIHLSDPGCPFRAFIHAFATVFSQALFAKIQEENSAHLVHHCQTQGTDFDNVPGRNSDQFGRRMGWGEFLNTV